MGTGRRPDRPGGARLRAGQRVRSPPPPGLGPRPGPGDLQLRPPTGRRRRGQPPAAERGLHGGGPRPRRRAPGPVLAGVPAGVHALPGHVPGADRSGLPVPVPAGRAGPAGRHATGDRGRRLHRHAAVRRPGPPRPRGGPALPPMGSGGAGPAGPGPLRPGLRPRPGGPDGAEGEGPAGRCSGNQCDASRGPGRGPGRDRFRRDRRGLRGPGGGGGGDGRAGPASPGPGGRTGARRAGPGAGSGRGRGGRHGRDRRRAAGRGPGPVPARMGRPVRSRPPGAVRVRRGAGVLPAGAVPRPRPGRPPAVSRRRR